MINAYFREAFEVLREDSIFWTLPASTSYYLGFTLPEPSYLRVHVSQFSEGTGLVECVGDVSETFDFDRNGQLVGSKQFSRVDWVYTADLVGETVEGYISLEMVTASGQPKPFALVISTGYCRVDVPEVDSSAQLYGVIERLKCRAFLPPGTTIRPGDSLRVGLTTYSVERVGYGYGMHELNHLEVYCV